MISTQNESRVCVSEAAAAAAVPADAVCVLVLSLASHAVQFTIGLALRLLASRGTDIPVYGPMICFGGAVAVN